MSILILLMIIDFENVLAQTQADEEHSEYRSGKFSAAFHILLPVAGLAFFLFGRKQIFTKLLLHFDKNCVSVFWPSFSKREKLLRWACHSLPPTWSSPYATTLSGGVLELWTDGSLLCTLLNTAIPGACPNPYRHWNQPPTHAQAIAYKYLGIEPIFTEVDLLGKLTPSRERDFIRYLYDIQQSMIKLAEDSEQLKKATSSSQCIARGMGLFSGEQYKKAVFYIYPEAKTSTSNVIVQIKGPYGTYGQATVPNFSKKITIKDHTQLETSKPDLGSDFIENFSKYFKYQRKHQHEGLEIDVVVEELRAKVTYIPKHFGMHEINMICNGELLKGCPFNVHVFCGDYNEDQVDNRVQLEDVKPSKLRRVISQEIDFIDEVIPMSELEEKYQTPEDRQESDGVVVTDDKEVEINYNVEIQLAITGGGEEEMRCSHVEDVAPASDDVEGKEEDEFQSIVADNKSNYDVVDGIDQEMTVSALSNDQETLDEFETGDDKFAQQNLSVQSELKSRNHPEILTDIATIPDKALSKNAFEAAPCCEGKQHFGHVICNVNNNDNLSKQRITTSYNSKINTDVNEAMFINNNNKITNALEADSRNEANFHIESKYIKDVNINKIKIPENFLKDPTKIAKINLEDKYFGKEIPDCQKIDDAIARNNKNTNSNKDNIEVFLKKMIDIPNNHKYFTIPDRFVQNEDPTNAYYTPHSKDTSPICLGHIAPEVEFTQLSVVERRKMFSRNSDVTTTTSNSSKYSSFSDMENADALTHHQLENLSILNVLDTLMGSRSVSLEDESSLSSVRSFESDEALSGSSVKETKNYWENMSNNNQSSIKHKKEEKKELIEYKRCRLLWNKPTDTPPNTLKKSPDTHKSADDIVSLMTTDSLKKKQNYKSLDNSLDECVTLTIEERKQMLLKHDYEIEMRHQEKLKSLKKKSALLYDSKNINNDSERSKVEGKSEKCFTPLMGKLEQHKSAPQLRVPKEENNNNSMTFTKKDSTKKISTFCQNDLSNSQGRQRKVRSHFKRALKYFQRLEESSGGRTKAISLEKSNSKKGRGGKRGGSLNFPEISERFSIHQLYDDVFGNFRGSPKRSVLVEALATFSKRENHLLDSDDDEDEIKYNILKNHVKRRKRKSIKSIFDVHY